MRIAVACALVATVVADAARACPTCATGDDTLTMIGGEQLYDGRVRAGVVALGRSTIEGGAGGRVAVDEWRVELGLSLAASRRVSFAVAVPIIARDLRFTPSDTPEQSFVLPGDPLVLGRWVAFQDAILRPRHVLSIHAGLRLPVAPARRYASGTPMIPEQQPGTGAFSPMAGVTWDLFATSSGWAAHAAVLGTWSESARGGQRASRVLNVVLEGQRALGDHVALRAGLDLRLDTPELENGRDDPDSGGGVLAAGGDVLLEPVTDVTFVLGVRVPVIEDLRGDQDEGPTFALGLTLDL